MSSNMRSTDFLINHTACNSTVCNSCHYWSRRSHIITFLMDGTKPGDWPSKTFVSSPFNFRCSSPALLLLRSKIILFPFSPFANWDFDSITFNFEYWTFVTFLLSRSKLLFNFRSSLWLQLQIAFLISHTLFFLQTRAAANSCLVNI